MKLTTDTDGQAQALLIEDDAERAALHDLLRQGIDPGVAVRAVAADPGAQEFVNDVQREVFSDE